LNISVENLEYEIADGLRRLLNTGIERIAFIEGHGELTEAETYDINKTLSRYFQIDIGKLDSDATVLTNYKVVIIAAPREPFSEADKYIIDQYLMNGGRVLWLLDGVRVNKKSLTETGISPAIALDLNLNDVLFRYGVRINPVIIEDMQCISIPVNVSPKGEYPQFEPSPWYFSPLLLTSPQHPVTKNVTVVKADFCSEIEAVGDDTELKKDILLLSSEKSQTVSVPGTIDVTKEHIKKDKSYFTKSYLPVAVSVEGIFKSAFTNRMKPETITHSFPFMDRSLKTRQIFIADGDIIRNETNGIASDSTTLPLGFDRYSNLQYGNAEFIKNAVLYLADESGWMQLRSKSVKLRLLNNQLIKDNKLIIQLLNVVLPVLFLIIAGIIYNIIRKRKYTK